MRVYLSPSIFMQRLAWLRVAAAFGASRSRTALELTNLIYSLASAPMEAAPDDETHLLEYARSRQAADRLEVRSKVPAQDLWLSRSSVSWNGSLTRESAAEIAKWATGYGVLKAESFTATAIGRRLLLLRTGEPDWTKITHNPFILLPAERFLFLQLLWDVDGDLLGEWVRLLPSDRDFDRSEAGDLLVPVLRALADRAESREVTGLARVAASLERQAGQPRSRGLREHWATPRLEQLVDIGILRKAQLPRFEFAFPPASLRFREHAADAPTSLGLAIEVWAPNSAEAGDELAQEALIRSYLQSRSGTGLAEIEDVWLLANADLLFAPKPAWVSRETLDRIVRMWLTNGSASFNVDKLGRVKYVKLRQDLLSGRA